MDPEGLSALVACRLIALDKNPGVRHIWIGGTLRRIIARAVLSTFKDDILKAAGSMQLCAGQESGCVHVMQKLFSSPEVEAVLLVDATNAFNSINRQTALCNIQHICPLISTILINTYRDDVNLFIDGERLLSEEGTTQGDPFAMPMYALALLPLINSQSDDEIKQMWYADDAASCGQIENIRSWWDKLVQIGPDYGYFPNPSKACLLVKEAAQKTASDIFTGTGISISWKKYLRAPLATASFLHSFIQQQIST